MNNKRSAIVSLVTLLLVVVLITPLFTACSNSSKTETSSQTQSTATTATAAAASDNKVYEFNYSGNEAATHPKALLMDWWANKIAELSQGRLKITNFHGGSLGSPSDNWEMVIKGSVAMADIGPYQPTKQPIQNTISQTLPFRLPSADAIGNIFWNLYYKGLLDSEIGDYKLLFMTTNDPFQVITTSKKLNTIEDFKGMRLRVPGDSATLRAFGADVVTMPLGEVYSSLEKGTIDGLLGGITIVSATKIEKLAKYINTAYFGAGVGYCVMNKDLWNSLPGDLQVILDEVSRQTYYKEIEDMQLYAEKITASVQTTGSELYQPSDEELARMRTQTASIFDNWTAEMESKGLQGNAINTEVKRVLALYGVNE